MAYKLGKKAADMRMPHEWWESARNMTRNFHLHLGPTNSGKTYTALTHLKASQKGVYCAPLRLLATQVYENLTSSGLKCSLITGQETVITPGATHLSCTIESLRLTDAYDCAIIDEIQMISDFERGSAWTYAILGLQAKEIHLTGEHRSKSILESIFKKTQDSHSEYLYKRLSSLSLSPPVTNLSQLRPGDCLIAFSRKKCHALKNYIEKKYPGSCSIIYGSLPPEVRRNQAEKFNTQQQKFLIATDAVGMGLNYNIDRVVFMETSKSDGKRRRPLLPHEVKQIAGRAGRYHNKGFVTACTMKDLTEITLALNHNQQQQISKAALTPLYEQIKEFAEVVPTNKEISYAELLVQFSKLAKLENIYFLQSIEEACLLANSIKNIGLTLEETHKFSHTPFRYRSQESLEAFKCYAQMVKDGRSADFRYFESLHDLKLERLEALYNHCEIYFGLSKKFGNSVFVDHEEVRRFCGEVSMAIQDRLNHEVEEVFEFKLDSK